MSIPTTPRDRAIGALLGLAAGDALGTTVEFSRPGSFAPLTDLVGGGPFRLQAGQWTDDTSMAMCLAESILDRGDLDPADQLGRYLAWRNDGYWSATGRCFDIGGTTARALSRFERTGAVTDSPVDEDSAANGSLMRLAPIPIRWHRSPAEAATRSAESSATTHPARRPTDACRVLGAMTAALIGGQTAEAVFAPSFWQFGALHPDVDTVRRGSWRAKSSTEIRGSGYSVEALEAALWAVDGATTFAEAVLRAANLGDDADTTAAIAGQLAGARWGASGIPERWRSLITDGERIASIAGLLYDAGSGTTTERWDLDDTLHAWWVDPPRILAGEYPSGLREMQRQRKLDVLIDHGIRTWIDLTTRADRLEPYGTLLHRAAAQRGLDLRRVNLPIPDMGVVDTATYASIVETIEAATERGGVYLHCWGGIGRTSTVVGCLLVRRGLSADEALQRIDQLRQGTRKAHRHAPETSAQRDAVTTFAATWFPPFPTDGRRNEENPHSDTL